MTRTDPPAADDATGSPLARRASHGRIDGVDAARGLALIGMFIAHAAPAATTFAGAELLAIADERPRLLFALTAGLALGFISGGTSPIPATAPFGGRERTRLRLQITVRAVILIALGLLIAATLAPLVYIILDEYGVAFLVLLPLLFLPRAVQSAVGAAGVLLAPGLAVLIAATPWVADVQAAGYGLFTEWFFSGAYPVVEWVSVMLVGLGLGRFGIDRPRVLAWTTLVGTTAALVALAPGVELLRIATVQRAEAGTDASLQASALQTAALGESLQAFGNVGVCAVVVAGAVLLTGLARPAVRRVAGAVLSPITAMGAMPLTIYTAHLVVLAAAKREEHGFITDDSWPLVIGLIVGSMVFAWCWRRWLGRGPLEELIRVASGRSRTAV